MFTLKAESSRRRVVLGVTASISAAFFSGQASGLREAGYDVTIVSSPGDELNAVAAREGVSAAAIPMQREISPIADCVSLLRLVRMLLRVRPTISDFGTPKAGLLGSIAAWIARVPCRIYTVRGLRLETVHGLKRALLFSSEWIACRCATRVRCVSPSLRDQIVALGIAPPDKTVVLGSGTCSGIDVSRFLPDAKTPAKTEQLRQALGILAGAPVVGFVGRFTRDKGIGELVDAFDALKQNVPGVSLLLVGDFEAGDPVPRSVRDRIEQDPSIVRAGFVGDTAPYYHLMDVLALPTYREGFPGVPLEAAAAGKPVVTTNATGARDAVVDRLTGVVVPVGDANALASALQVVLANPDLANEMGAAGSERVERDFSRQNVVTAALDQYEELMRSVSGTRQRGWLLFCKRGLDFALALVALIVLSPILLATALIVLLTMGQPILFRQPRPGRQRVPFTLLKFRTMLASSDDLSTDEQRLTRIGRFLRASSLDELPQLVNVLRGELSLVGPRPLLMQYLDRYTPEQTRRHDVMPGITGWAQINGRNTLSWQEKFHLDVWYVDHWSLGLDLAILCKTLWRVVHRDGVSQAGHATMPEFQGEKSVQRGPVTN